MTEPYNTICQTLPDGTSAYTIAAKGDAYSAVVNVLGRLSGFDAPLNVAAHILAFHLSKSTVSCKQRLNTLFVQQYISGMFPVRIC